ncbi:hypothetical protein WA026_006938 [Henosepilachna vigintioctopunctata]|uniref:Uncharacterized protein n=1 Tax=Henosepilachna vigintioctopunctata TaxID=420089 RepID=A0AAW1V2R5_9CUCU
MTRYLEKSTPPSYIKNFLPHFNECKIYNQIPYSNRPSHQQPPRKNTNPTLPMCRLCYPCLITNSRHSWCPTCYQTSLRCCRYSCEPHWSSTRNNLRECSRNATLFRCHPKECRICYYYKGKGQNF